MDTCKVNQFFPGTGLMSWNPQCGAHSSVNRGRIAPLDPLGESCAETRNNFPGADVFGKLQSNSCTRICTCVGVYDSPNHHETETPDMWASGWSSASVVLRSTEYGVSRERKE